MARYLFCHLCLLSLTQQILTGKANCWHTSTINNIPDDNFCDFYTSSWSESLNVPTLHTFHQGLITLFAYLKETHCICLNNHYRLCFQQGDALIYYELLASCQIACAGQGGSCGSQMSWILKYTHCTSKGSQMDCSQLSPKTWVASVNQCCAPCGVYSINSNLTLH